MTFKYILADWKTGGPLEEINMNRTLDKETGGIETHFELLWDGKGGWKMETKKWCQIWDKYRFKSTDKRGWKYVASLKVDITGKTVTMIIRKF